MNPFLNSPKHKWFEQRVKTGNQVQLLAELFLVKILIEILSIDKNIRQQEVKQRPELVKIVLQRRSCKQQAVSRPELAQDQREL